MQESNKVGERQDFFYVKGDKDYRIFYQNILKILSKDFNFDKVSEKGPVKYEPMKPKVGIKVIATKDKDLRTAIEITVKISYKKPPVKLRETKDTIMINMSYKGEVITKYKKDTSRQRSIFQEKLRNFMEKNFYKKEREKYAEECEELIEAIRNKVRELYGEPAPIGRSSRTHYNPTW